MSKTERHVTNARAELATAHLASLQEHDRETSQSVEQLVIAADTMLEFLKRKRTRLTHPG